ncbi:MAG: DUF4340 domain-containing protein [Bacteroidales bacterium]
MKRNQIILIIVILLGIVAFWLVSRNTHQTIRRELRDFAIEDTASVTRIFMVRKDNASVTLTRENGVWMVNDKYPARGDAMDVLMKTLNRIRVKSPVSKAMLDNAVKMLATRNTKVEVYKGRKLLKTIYVGGPTQDQMGTFMMLEGSSVPFLVHIPGFTGYLSTRFFVEEDAWKSTDLFKYNFDDITAVTVNNPEKPDESFRVENAGGNNFRIVSTTGIEAPGPVDTLRIKFYLNQFEKVGFEFHADGFPQLNKDSLLAAQPYRQISLLDRRGKETTVTAYRRYANGKTDVDGEPLLWDDERLWAVINDNEWVVIQYYVFDGLFRDYSEFFQTAGRN